MHQKAQLIATIINSPDLLIVDEPFQGLDPVNATMLKSLLLEQRNRGAAVVMSTHDMEDAQLLCDRILLIDKGRRVLYGKVDDVRRAFSDGAVEVVGITGSSGAGAVALPTTHHPVRANNLRTYKPLEHPHTPEIVAALASAGGSVSQLSFVPVSAPLARGIFATCFVRVDAAQTEASLLARYLARYAGERFVRVPRKRLPEVVAVSGSPYAEVGLALGNDVGGERVLSVFSALDNLIRGGAGQAIQNLNLMLGVDEATTLEDYGAYP